MIRSVAVLAVFGVLLSSHVALSQAKTEYTVVVQDYVNFPPYSAYKDKNYSGFNRELLDLFASSKGYNFKYVAFPVKRLFFEFVNGVGDMKYPDNPKWALHVKKDAPIVYSDAVVQYIDGVMVLPSNKGNNIDSVKNLGVVAGWTPWVYMKRKKAGKVKLLENSSYEGLLKQAMFGRNDGAYSNVSTSQYYLKNVLKKPGALVFDDSLLHVRSARTLSSIKHPKLIAEFNSFLKSHSAQIEALKNKFSVEDGIVSK
jgi:polar amino acid transport system substrate-binding protein